MDIQRYIRFEFRGVGFVRRAFRLWFMSFGLRSLRVLALGA